MCLEKKLDKEHDKTPYGEWAGYYDDIFRFVRKNITRSLGRSFLISI